MPRKIPSPKEMLVDIGESLTAQNGIRLNDWEETFYNNMKAIINRGGQLTEKQKDSLEEIWDRV